ncbi:MAG: hypothetical protein AAGN66_05470 [Acidobacteriota bacterium]
MARERRRRDEVHQRAAARSGLLWFFGTLLAVITAYGMCTADASIIYSVLALVTHGLTAGAAFAFGRRSGQ